MHLFQTFHPFNSLTEAFNLIKIKYCLNRMDSQISNTSNQLNMQKVYEPARRNIFNGDLLGFQTESTNVIGELK